MLRKIIAFLLIMIFSWALLIGGVVGVGYSFVMKEDSAGKLADTVGGALQQNIDLDDDVAALSVYQYAVNVMALLANLSDAKISDLEGYFGMRIISDNIEEVVGLSADLTRASTVADLPETITANVSLATATENFGIDLPKMPIFDDDSFTSKSLSTAFSSMTGYPLESFITVTYTADATETKPASSAILQKLGPYTLDEISKNSKAITNTLTLAEMVKITETSPKILKTLANNTAADLYDEDGNLTSVGISTAIKTTAFKDMVEVGDSYFWNYLGECTLENLGTKIDNMTLGDVIEINEDSYVLLQKLKDTKITNMGTEISQKIEECTLGELIDIDGMSNPEPILVALKDTKMDTTSINTTIANLEVKDVFKEYDCGILGLVASDTKLTEVPNVVVNDVLGCSLYVGSTLDLYTFDTTSLSVEQKAYLLNRTAFDIVEIFPKMMTGEVTPATMKPEEVVFSGTTLTQDVLDTLSIANGTTIKINSAVTIPDDEVFTTYFNVQTVSGGSVTVGTNVAFDYYGGYAYFKGNISGATSVTSTQQIKVDSVTYVDAMAVEFFILS